MRAIAIYCLSALLLSVTPHAAEAMMKKYDLNIPRQSLNSALNEFSRVTGLQVARMSDQGPLVGEVGPLRGEYDVRAALDVLLKNSGLKFEFLSDRMVRIFAPSTNSLEGTPGAYGRGDPLMALSGDGASDDARRCLQGQAPPAGGAPDNGGGSSSGTGQSGAGAPGRGASATSLSEVIVTAQKRDERLQEVPVPVTAIRADTLVQTNQLRLQDYYTSVPGLSVAPANQSTQLISIRGITTGGVTNPTVGVTIDDVPFGASTNAGGGLVVPDIDPGDLASVEVLRGPQGSLYGASSMGGLVKFITVNPSTAGLSGRIEAGVSDVENGAQAGYQFRGSVNVPLGDTLAIRASAFTHQDPGYIDNPVLHIKGINEEHVSGGRLSALWRPSDSVSLKLSAIYQEANGDGSNVVEVPTAGYPQTTGLRELDQNDLRGTGGYDRKIQAYSATLAAKVGIFDVTAISGFNINQFSDSFDYSYAFGSYAQALLGVSGSPILNFSKTEKFSQELRLNAPIGEHIDWLIGGFYTHEHSIFSENIAAADPATGGLVGTLIYVPIPTTYAEYAGFTDLTFRLSDRFDVQLGARESEIKQTFSETESGAFFPTPSIVPQTDTNASAFTYLFTPRFKISTDLMVYARLASGYRAGGSNPLPGSGTPPEYRPDKTQDYDLGIKADLWDHSVSLDASLYHIDWKNIQLQLFNPLTGGDYNTNGSRAKSQGLELSVQSRPLTGLTVAAWITWDNAELTEPFPPGSTAVGTSGDPLPNTSKFSSNVSLQQEFPLGTDLSGFVGGAVSYIGERQGLFTSSPERQYFPAYAKTDLRAGVNYNSWTANLYANNVADRRGVISGGLGTFPPFGFYLIEPRTVGLSLVKSF